MGRWRIIRPNMATQRFTILKVVGEAGRIIAECLREWAAARHPKRKNEFSADQWPKKVREKADRLASELKANSSLPPVVHFVEWIDCWSMGDLINRWLVP